MSNITTPTPAVSDETQVTPGAPDGTKETKDDNDELVSRAELAEATKRRDAAAARARKLESDLNAEREARSAIENSVKELQDKLKQLEGVKRQIDDAEAIRKGDIEALRKSAKDREDELLGLVSSKEQEISKVSGDWEARFKSLETKFFQNFVEKDAIAKLSEITIHPETALMHIRSKLELEEDADGNPVGARIKDSTLEIARYVEKHFEENGLDFLLKTRRKNGSETQPAETHKGEPTKSVSLKDISASPDKGKSLFSGNPELAVEYLKTVKLTGQ